MRPADQYSEHDLTHVQSDPAILYASLELSQSSWLVTSLSPGSEKMSKYTTSAGDGAALLALLTRLQNRARGARTSRRGLSLSKRPALTVFGCIDFLRSMGSRVMLSIRLRSLSQGGAGEPRQI
jgi:hypothetical protein